MAQLVILGLLGGVGSGKSTVARAFADLGAEWIDADAIAREVSERPSVVDSVRGAFGEEVVRDGAIDRERLAQIVFRDPADLRRLNAIVHPAVRDEIDARIARLRDLPGEEPRLVILDVPLLLESPLNQLCDKRLFVDTPLDVRLQRVAENRGWDAGELERREKNQNPLAAKRAAADYNVSNAGSMALVQSRAQAIFGELIQTASTTKPTGTRSSPGPSDVADSHP